MLTNEQLDDLDTFALHVLAPHNKESVREYGRAVAIAAYNEARQACITIMKMDDSPYGAAAGECAVAIDDLMRGERHPDDAAVDRFASAMKQKLAEKRVEGRGGWNDPKQCSIAFLIELLHEHMSKGDPVDVGNFAMMLWNRGGSTNEGNNDESR